MAWLQNKFEKNFLITTVDYVFNWARKSAVWPHDVWAGLLRHRNDRVFARPASTSPASARKCFVPARGRAI